MSALPLLVLALSTSPSLCCCPGCSLAVFEASGDAYQKCLRRPQRTTQTWTTLAPASTGQWALTVTVTVSVTCDTCRAIGHLALHYGTTTSRHIAESMHKH